MVTPSTAASPAARVDAAVIGSGAGVGNEWGIGRYALRLTPAFLQISRRSSTEPRSVEAGEIGTGCGFISASGCSVNERIRDNVTGARD